MESWSDERLLQATPTQPDAFDVFYRRHEAGLLAYFVRRVRNGEVAADLASESFAAALLNVRRFDARRGDAVGWLYGIARHRLLRAVERGRVEDRARRRLGIEPAIVDDEMIQRIEQLGTDVSAAELLGQLTDDQARAVRAHVIEERSYAEIAADIRTSEAVIRQRVSRGLRTLRARLKESS